MTEKKTQATKALCAYVWWRLGRQSKAGLNIIRTIYHLVCEVK